MSDVRRISPADAREKSVSGQALLVCAYESGNLCERNRLEGSMTAQELASMAPSLPKNQEIVFYCA